MRCDEKEERERQAAKKSQERENNKSECSSFSLLCGMHCDHSVMRSVMWAKRIILVPSPVVVLI